VTELVLAAVVVLERVVAVLAVVVTVVVTHVPHRPLHRLRTVPPSIGFEQSSAAKLTQSGWSRTPLHSPSSTAAPELVLERDLDVFAAATVTLVVPVAAVAVRVAVVDVCVFFADVAVAEMVVRVAD
jgi:hypothetical protein